MSGLQRAEATHLLAVAGVVLVLCLGVSGCGQATDPPTGGQMPTPETPAGSGAGTPESVQAAPEAGASGGAPASSGVDQPPTSGTTMSAEEISRHFKVKTTDAARAAADAVEASGKKAEAAVEEATR